MYRFSTHSLVQIDTLDVQLQELCWEAIEYVDFRVIEGARSEARQTEMCEADPPLSYTPWPTGAHNCPEPGQTSRAFDAAPCPIDWDDKSRLYLFAGFMLGVAAHMNIPLRCGADWDGDFTLSDQSFHDLCHFETGEA